MLTGIGKKNQIVPSQRTIRTGKDIEGDTDDEGQPADERHEDAFAEGA